MQFRDSDFFYRSVSEEMPRIIRVCESRFGAAGDPQLRSGGVGGHQVSACPPPRFLPGAAALPRSEPAGRGGREGARGRAASAPAGVGTRCPRPGGSQAEGPRGWRGLASGPRPARGPFAHLACTRGRDAFPGCGHSLLSSCEPSAFFPLKRRDTSPAPRPSRPPPPSFTSGFCCGEGCQR